MADATTTPESTGFPGPPSGRRRGHRWLILTGSALLVLAGAALFAIEPLRDPLPPPSIELTVPTSMTLPGGELTLPWPESGQAAVSINGLGTVGTSGKTTTAVPIASVTKVMTAYVILTGHPLKVGEPGPSLTITAKHVTEYEKSRARGESVVAVAAGAKFTERQALQAVLLPSANNMARILAAWDAGSVDAFVDKMNATAARLGMTRTHYTDPAGYDPDTISTAVDQTILARAAMELPVFAEIAKQREVTLPVAGTVPNYNDLVGHDGVVGIKTGSTDESGGCLMFAAVATVGTVPVTIVGTILGAPGTDTPEQLDAVFARTRPLLRAVADALDVHTLIPAGQQIGTVRGPLGTGTTVTAGRDLTVVGWPGMRLRLTPEIPQARRRLAAGAELGQLTAVNTIGGAPTEVVLLTGAPMEPPSTWTRLRQHR